MKSQHIRSGSLEPLRSLRRIHVKVDSLPSEVKAAGLSAQTLEQDILADLKEAPVGTLTEIGILHVRGKPTLHIRGYLCLKANLEYARTASLSNSANRSMPNV